MVLDAQTQAILDQANEEGAPQLYEMSVEDARAALRDMSLALDIEKSEIHKRIERSIPGPQGEIPLRIYWPQPSMKGGILPILMLYHGGGFVIGDLDTHENMARYYCKHGKVIVISVDYRLAPENSFPIGIEDAYTALCWASEHASEIGGDSNLVAVTGDSAGGNISAVLCQLVKARCGPRIAYQFLSYPVVHMNLKADYKSRKTYGGGEYFLGFEIMEWFNKQYFNNPKEVNNPMASPILTSDLTDLPPALIITAGHDMLVDEGKHYAQRLKEAGVPVEYVCYESTIHGFMSFAGVVDAGREALDLVASRLKTVLI